MWREAEWSGRSGTRRWKSERWGRMRANSRRQVKPPWRRMIVEGLSSFHDLKDSDVVGGGGVMVKDVKLECF